MIRRGVVLVVLSLAIMVSAVLVVRTTYRAHQLHHQLRLLRIERYHLTIEWAQLRLEESTWSNPARVSRIAHKRLNMRQPRDYIVIGEKR